ncbi:MAG: aspartyl/asparaginyl beta-hydroxylase domain-containing protein [Oscillatoriales cyanobacterium RM2_1_1]|nr:aspartyl/asparaginyl beta-hydroxylase domain-containing protein [Oscillatoriales cyanobacterium SM2_3_0]NJO44916.1 aspartyl/asparaginyl beta-hydroxylase domain-containing protein [Oscillatoriales cyanobacterium RM2_1_1]
MQAFISSIQDFVKDLQPKIKKFLLLKVGLGILWNFEKVIPKFSLLGDTPFFEREQLDWVPELEARWPLIRQELDEILKYRDELPNFQDITPDIAASTSLDNLWKTYFFYGYGIKVENSCNRCPETARALEKIPGLKTAFFSILLPGKHIAEHRGPYKGVLRCLLGLKIPQPQELCRIRVANETRYWEEGKCLLFDDSFPHEAWNETDETRVVLFIDFVHPLRFPVSWINRLFVQLIALSPFIQDSGRNQQKWDKRLEEVFSRARSETRSEARSEEPTSNVKV